jgi:hypothetical protein
LEKAPRGSRVILNPSNLSADEVLEVLYEGQGKITHLEVFNLKDWAEGRMKHRESISRIRLVLNGGDPLEARAEILEIIKSVEGEPPHPGQPERLARLRHILADIPRFQDFYRHSHLKSRLGSDSTGRSRRSRGMGLVAVESLPSRARRQIRQEHRLLPVRTTPLLQVIWKKRQSSRPLFNRLLCLLRHLPLLQSLGYHHDRQWLPAPNSTCLAAKGNIAALGGLPEHYTNWLLVTPQAGAFHRPSSHPLHYLNTPTKNLLKVIVGFIPAFFTFFLTKDWWLLAYFGAVIWFAITGFRNVLQSVLGGGGVVRSPLLRWNDFISWGRVSDSLLFTGFSVPLLDYLVKTLLLAQGFNITTSTNPTLLYGIMALANGCYISSHNIFRGLAATVALGNFFRAVLSIPLAIGFNLALVDLLPLAGMAPAEVAINLQLWAAVISKMASDVVGGFIEGLSDRGKNLALRSVDYQDKLRQMREVESNLAMLFPDKDVLALLDNPKQLVGELGQQHQELLQQLAINSLDCMYFWMLQPRGRHLFRKRIRMAKESDRHFFFDLQHVLERKRTLSEMFVAGMLGKRYDQALAFYLSRVDGYLKQIKRLEARAPRHKQ